MKKFRKDPKLMAPCGVNCHFCYVFLRKKKPCEGCRNQDESKPEHCRKCKIKDCIHQKELEYCWECEDYPCAIIKRMDKSYRQRYGESIIQQAQVIQEKGWDAYFDKEDKRLRCPQCQGLLSIHRKFCSECGFKVDAQT